MEESPFPRRRLAVKGALVYSDCRLCLNAEKLARAAGLQLPPRGKSVSVKGNDLPGGRFGLGSAIRLGLGTVGHHLFKFLLLAVLVFGALGAVLAGVFLGVIKPLMSGADGQFIFSLNRLPAVAVAMTVVCLGVAWLTAIVFQAGVSDMTLRRLGDGRSSVSQAVFTAVRRFVPLVLQRIAFYGLVAAIAVPLALTFIIGGYLGGPPGGPIPWLLTYLGPVLAVAAVVWMATVHAFKVPVLVGEGLGFAASLSRGAAMTRGNRLRLLALAAFFVLLAALPAAAWLGLVGLMPFDPVPVAVYAAYVLFLWVWAIAANASACCEVLATQLTAAAAAGRA